LILLSSKDLLDVLEDPEMELTDTLMKLLGSALPMPGFQAESRLTVELADPYLRETRGPHGETAQLRAEEQGLTYADPLAREVADLWEEIASRTPGNSDDLYPTREAGDSPMGKDGPCGPGAEAAGS
jgi:hypothetical protein